MTKERVVDAPLAITGAFPDLKSKPLLFLDGSNLQVPPQTEWQRRQEEIEDQIQEPRYTLAREVLVGHKGEPLDDRRKHRRVRYRYTTDRRVRRDAQDIWIYESKDEREIIHTYFREGDVVCQLLGGEDVTALAPIFGRVGKSGKVYYVSQGRRLGERLYERLFDLFVDFSYGKDKGLKGTDRIESDGGRKIIPKRLAKEVTWFLVRPYYKDLDFYLSGFEGLDVKTQSAAFYSRFPIVPVESSPPIPTDIRSGSIGTAIELGRFSTLPEGRKEEFLWEIDRILKPGGIIVFREGSQAQAEIEYYGEGLLTRYYQRWSPRGLYYPADWMIFQKLDAGAQIHTGAQVEIPQDKELPAYALSESPIAREDRGASRKRSDGGVRRFYTAADIAKELKISPRAVRIITRNLGFEGEAPESQRFTPESYFVILDIVKEEIERIVGGNAG